MERAVEMQKRQWRCSRRSRKGTVVHGAVLVVRSVVLDLEHGGGAAGSERNPVLAEVCTETTVLMTAFPWQYLEQGKGSVVDL